MHFHDMTLAYIRLIYCMKSYCNMGHCLKLRHKLCTWMTAIILQVTVIPGLLNFLDENVSYCQKLTIIKCIKIRDNKISTIKLYIGH